AACDFEWMYLPFRDDQLDDALQHNVALQIALDSYMGQTSSHYPSHRIFKLELKIVKDPVQSREPLKALTVFTDGSGATGKSVITWQDPSTLEWEKDVEIVEGSPQVAELAAVVRAFDRFHEPFNLVTDSAYVAGVVSRAECAWVAEHGNPKIRALLVRLVELLSHRKQPYYVMHTRSHTNLPGFIAEGNRVADALAEPVSMATLPDKYQQVVLSHAKFHQNIRALMRDFELKKDQARAIVATCPNCQPLQLPSIQG
ncbi:POK19 protein, partial [Pachycephala philippinensis]|nr:POK19 protein [Pachycephala philippinensis]